MAPSEPVSWPCPDRPDRHRGTPLSAVIRLAAGELRPFPDRLVDKAHPENPCTELKEPPAVVAMPGEHFGEVTAVQRRSHASEPRAAMSGTHGSEGALRRGNAPELPDCPVRQGCRPSG